MSFAKVSRSRIVVDTLGRLVAGYIRLVGRTTRWQREPGDLRGALKGDLPLIMALWHGQHLLTPIAWPKGWPGAALVARHRDGEINAVAVQKLGFALVRGSGTGTRKIRRKTLRRQGGAGALRALLRTLRGGTSVTMTADVPKIAGIAGQGVVLLAKLSGRPVYPLAVITRRGFDLNSWDRARIPLPFGRGAIVVGEAVRVAADADEAALEKARGEIERRLDLVHARAYELAGGKIWRSLNG